jgi:hypothetical protein
MGFGTRQPTSNDLPGTPSRWGGNELMDDVALVLNGLGARCQTCTRVTRNQHLQDGKCPDCR